MTFLFNYAYRYVIAIYTMSWLRLFSGIVARSSTTWMNRASALSISIVVGCILGVFKYGLVSCGRTFARAVYLFFFINRFPFLCFSIVFIDRPLRYLMMEGLFILRSRIRRVPSLATARAFTWSFTKERAREENLFVIRQT